MDDGTRAAALIEHGPRGWTEVVPSFDGAIQGPEAVFSAQVSELTSLPGVGKSLAQAIATAPGQINVQQELEECQA